MHRMLIAVTIYILDQSIYIYLEKTNFLDTRASVRPVSNVYLVRAYLCKCVTGALYKEQLFVILNINKMKLQSIAILNFYPNNIYVDTAV